MKKKTEKKAAERGPKETLERAKEPSPQEDQERAAKAPKAPASPENFEEKVTPEEWKALQEKASERDEFLDKLKRERADYANYQKRVQREKESLTKYLLQDFLSTLLPVVDNLQRAIHSADRSRDFNTLLDGVKMVERQFLKTLEDRGVEPIEAEGKAFDPAFHEAALQVENEEVPNNTVVEEILKGYQFHDRILRATKVVVSKREERDTAAAGNTESAEEKKAEGETEKLEERREADSDPSSAARE